MADLLEEEDYWQAHPVLRVSMVLAWDLGLLILGTILIAFLALTYSWHVDSDNTKLKQEQTCLDKYGQWIKGDCVNNLINIAPQDPPTSN